MTSSSEQGCVFCAVVARKAPAREVLRTDQYIVIIPDFPAVLGHVLLVPTNHVRDIWDIEQDLASVLGRATMSLGNIVRSATNCEGLNVIQSNGSAAGQTVFHLHIHLVPRRQGDRMPKLWPDDVDWSASEIDDTTANLRAAAHLIDCAEQAGSEG